MQFCSTRNEKLSVSAAEAIAQGLSAEGGLFVPTRFPKADLEKIMALPDYPSITAHVLSLFLTDYQPEFLKSAAEKAYGEGFQGRAGQMTRVEDDVYALELWHGPTCAFKDYALQLLPHLLVEAKRLEGKEKETFILVATSGDTGKAALEGFKDIPGVRIAVFYPSEGTSKVQRLQMTTQAGSNVAVYAVKGNFDDAQTGVKRVFADPELNEELAAKGVELSSANSINWGRLAPQIAYYFSAYQHLLKEGAVRMGEEVDFCVPTGNFGDILAGWYAKQMGLPVGKLICASNKNNVLTEFFETGCYNARRTFYRTSSPSMDILVSSNLERLLWHMGGTWRVSGWMKDLAEKGSYQVEMDIVRLLNRDFSAGYATEEETAQEIAALFKKGYLCDPHTAVAFKTAREYRKKQESRRPMVVLSTASPFKFPGDVLAALGETVPEDEFAAMKQLSAAAHMPAPKALAGLEGKKERFTQQLCPQEIPVAARGEK